MKQSQIGYYFIVMASIVIVLAGVKLAAGILVPFLLSLFIAIILSPAYNFFKSKGIPDILSMSIVMIIFLLFVMLVARLIGNSITDFSANIDQYLQRLTDYYKALSIFTQKLGLEIPVDEIASIVNTKQIMLFSKSLLESLSSVFTNSFVVIFTVIFMLLESTHFVQKINFTDNNQETMKHINQIFTQIKSYMVLKALVSLLTGLIVWISLYLIGTDYAFLWGVFAFLLNFIPNIGSIIAAVPAVLITLVQLGGISALIVSGLYVVINVIVGSVIEPKVMGRGLGLSTLVVFLSLIFWGWLLGLVGMLLSIPLTIMLKIIFNANEKTQWLSVLLGNGENLQKSLK